MQEKVLNNINYKFYFEKNNKDNILILHWWWGTSASWCKVAEMLSKNWYNTYIPDLAWFGKTAINRVYTLEDYALDIIAFAEALNLKDIILWGHSNWGAIAIKIWNRIKIKKLVLNNSAWIREDKQRNFKKKFCSIVAKPLKPFAKIKIFRTCFYKLVWASDYLNSQNKPFLKETFLNMIKSDLKNEIKNINSSTLIIWGEKDSYTPLRDWEYMRDNIKDNKFVVLKNEKHWIHLQNPSLLVRTFLENIK